LFLVGFERLKDGAGSQICQAAVGKFSFQRSLNLKEMVDAVLTQIGQGVSTFPQQNATQSNTEEML
jgi:hypothetical protein